MPGLGDILGQPHAVQQLERALARDTAHHAYLFDGPEGVGKRTTAIAFAAAANCAVAPSSGCGECESCRRILGGLHPDVKLFDMTQKGLADRVRELLSTLAFPPHEAKRRVVVMDPADELHDTAANILLKTLEEPPPRTHFVLVSARAASLLVTIRSRCQRLAFAPLPAETVARLLVERHGVEASAAEEAASLAQGSLGRAVELATAEDFPRRRAQVERLLGAAAARRPTAALEAASELAGDRDEALAVLELLWVSYRDAIVLSAVGEAEAESELGRAQTARHGQARKLAERVPLVGLERGQRAVADATEAIEGNVGPQLALEALLLGLQRARAA